MNVTIKNINGRDIFVNHGRIYILLASGAGAMSVKLEEANEDELKFAVGPDCEVDCELVATFKVAVKTTAETTADETTAEANTATETATTKYAVDTTEFDSVVSQLIKLPANEFVELVDYAKRHSNRFPKYSKFEQVVNADDAYYSALIDLTRPWSEDVEKKAFEVFGTCASEKTIKMITVLQSAYTAVRDSGGDMQTFFCIKEVVDAYMSTL